MIYRTVAKKVGQVRLKKIILFALDSEMFKWNILKIAHTPAPKSHSDNKGGAVITKESEIIF